MPAPPDDRDPLERSLVNPHRNQHSDMVVERVTDSPGAYHARAQPSLERLAQRGHLSPRQAAAGSRIYSSWALGICGARDADAGGCTVHDPGGIRDRQLDAATEYRRLREAIGPRMWPLAFHVCCLDWSPARFANELAGGMHKLGAMAVLRVALDIAADHLGLDD
jgi:hypothetical protein